jgi:hypothetical protein
VAWHRASLVSPTVVLKASLLLALEESATITMASIPPLPSTQPNLQALRQVDSILSQFQNGSQDMTRFNRTPSPSSDLSTVDEAELPPSHPDEEEWKNAKRRAEILWGKRSGSCDTPRQRPDGVVVSPWKLARPLFHDGPPAKLRESRRVESKLRRTLTGSVRKRPSSRHGRSHPPPKPLASD